MYRSMEELIFHVRKELYLEQKLYIIICIQVQKLEKIKQSIQITFYKSSSEEYYNFITLTKFNVHYNNLHFI